MYDLNLSYFKELTMYILAGKRKLRQVQEEVLPALVERPNAPASPRTPRRPTIWTLCARALRRSSTTWN